MQNSDKHYSFLLKQSKENRIYIRKIELSKKVLLNSLISFAVLIAFVSVGTGLYITSAKSEIIAASTLPESEQPSAAAVLTVPAAAQLPKTIDYSRPGDSDQMVINSGGPFDSGSVKADDPEIERRLKMIQATGNPASIPSMWAHMGKINNEFGFRRSPFGGRSYEFHAGMDIDGDRGDMVVAPANGVVLEAGWKGGYGQMIEIDHGNGLTTRYGHLSKIEVNAGDTLTRGQLIALVGSTGRSTGPHLHYELRINDRPINPRRFLPPEPTDLKKIKG